MKITRMSMASLDAALTRLYDLGIGEENLGFWLNEENAPYREDRKAAREDVVRKIPALRAACVEILGILEDR